MLLFTILFSFMPNSVWMAWYLYMLSHPGCWSGSCGA